MNEKILLVDDEVDFLDVLSEFLRDEGYVASTARNAQEALELLQKETFRLLLSDINMPGMKGFELIKKVKQLYPTHEVFVHLVWEPAWTPERMTEDARKKLGM